MTSLSFHAANRTLERGLPWAVVEGCDKVKKILNHKPLKFEFKGIVIVAALHPEGYPQIITAYKADYSSIRKK
ncbi:MAG: hypothetical protein RBR08_15170 [Desulforegulaceae bacterium]|nr:hypothetical protein [Desulforegulaceae bacterium]